MRYRKLSLQQQNNRPEAGMSLQLLRRRERALRTLPDIGAGYNSQSLHGTISADSRRTKHSLTTTKARVQ